MRSTLIVFSFILAFLSGIVSGQDDQPTRKKDSPFNENKMLEFRLLVRLRSAQVIHLISPISGTNYMEDKIPFEWESSGSKKLFLGILNNKNKEVYYKELTGKMVNISAAKIGLKPGLYYWIIESEEETLNLGKFYFRKTR
jgi:hypothetical protein